MFRVGFALTVGLAAAGTAAYGQAKASIPACATASEGAQQNVTGTVTDKTGAVITSATIQAKCGDRSIEAHTSGDGRYSISLAPGNYLLEVNAAGFASYRQPILVDRQALTADISLAIPNAANTVTVQAEAGLVATDSTTAMKTDTPILETPQSISVITRDLMDLQAPQSINEALRYAPGIVPESQGNTSSFWNSSSLQLRGFNPNIYQDGLADDATGNTLLDAYFYQRIEILEGPSSVLYGQGSLAGIVNVETKRPTASPFREIQYGTGTFGRYEGNFDFSGPLGTPHLLYRLTGVAFREGSQTWFINPRRMALAPAFTWLPDSKTSLTLLTNYTYNPEVGAYANVPALGSALFNPKGKIQVGFFPGDPNFNKTKQSFIQAGDVFTRSFDHGWRIDQDFRFTGNKDNANMIWPEDLEADGETLDRYTFTRHTTFNSTLSDQRLVRTLDLGKLRQVLLAGVNYMHDSEHWTWGDGTIDPINIFHPVYHVPFVAPTLSGHEVLLESQTGVYFQDQASLGRLRLSVAGRQDWLTGNLTETGLPFTAKLDQSKFTVRTGAVFLAGHGLAPYFSYGTSFQPDLALAPPSSSATLPTVLPPTTGQQFEGGIKYQPEHVNAFLTAAVYNLTEQNVGLAIPNNPSFSQAVGEIRSRGFELQGHTSLGHRLSMIASYAYTSSLYTKSDATDVALDGTTEPEQGKYQYGVPKNIASFWADYNLPFAALNGLGVGAGSRFVGGSWGDAVNSFKVSGATLFDGSMHYDFPRDSRLLRGARLQVNASNIGNRTYVASCDATDSCYYGIKLAVYGTLRYRW